ncbi:FGGY family carbohydrate kinase [Microbacterium sp. X-17]|uniref:FGGY family carbohydrate kinase n=1 Tax=Microbacterium sp. X-17 TaxID=3144404 RepID=UPI0031F53F79
MNTIRDGVILSVDQGTGSTKGLALDSSGRILATASVPLGLSHPQAGWVEQDAEHIARSVQSVLGSLRSQIDRPVAGVGLSTQRESAVVWDTATGRPLSPVLGWQDRRTAPAAERLKASMIGQEIRDISGLPVDPMFSALKFAWILDRIDPDRRRANAGEITLGTVDAWLIHRLTGGRSIERGNASRTQLLDHRSGEWSEILLDAFGVPLAALPTVVDSDATSGPLRALDLGGAAVLGVFGDSHAALFGHGVREEGSVKVTYGTGSSVMGLGSRSIVSGLTDTIAWSRAGRIAHAFEGNILSTGGTTMWLAELLGTDAAEIFRLAENASPATVDLVPAFAGLGAPWWDENAIGIISGLTLGTDRAQLARAAVESIALQIEDILSAADTGVDTRIERVHVDGGPAGNDSVMQLQADISGRTIVRPKRTSLSALGAAWLAGQTAGIWPDGVAPWGTAADFFEPESLFAERTERRSRWRAAVDRARLRPTDRPDFTYDTLKEIP